MSLRPVRPSLIVAAVSTAIVGAVFWHDVSRARSLRSMGSGGISAVAAPKSAFPLAPLAGTSLLAAETGWARSSPSAPRALPAIRTAPPAELAFASRRLIRTADLSIEVERWEAAADRIDELAAELGGYLAEVRAAHADEKWRGTLMIRVPADRFDEAFRRLSRLGKTTAQSIGTQDVTRTVVDLDARIRVKKDVAERMRAVLRERTAKLADIVEAEQELAKVVEALEQLEAERRLYEQQTAFSAITVNLAEPFVAKPPVQPSVFLPVAMAFRESAAVLASSLAALVYTVVVAAPWALLAVLTWALIGRHRARRRAASLEAQG